MAEHQGGNTNLLSCKLVCGRSVSEISKKWSRTKWNLSIPLKWMAGKSSCSLFLDCWWSDSSDSISKYHVRTISIWTKIRTSPQEIERASFGDQLFVYNWGKFIVHWSMIFHHQTYSTSESCLLQGFPWKLCSWPVFFFGFVSLNKSGVRGSEIFEELDDVDLPDVPRMWEKKVYLYLADL